MRSNRRVIWSAVVAVCLAFVVTSTLSADDRDNNLRADPFTFVGKPGDCGTLSPGVLYPAGSRIVTSAWLTGMGLPDNGDPNFGVNPTDNPNKRDPHSGLLLSKNGPTPDCSAAGADIQGVKGMEVTATFALGFDFRNGGHCGAGAPRFNVVTRLAGVDTSQFVGGCANGVQTPALQDPLQWTTARFPVVAASGSRIQSISIIFDEGTDAPSVQDPMGVGLAVLDNIFVNGQFIRSGEGGCSNGNKDNNGKD